METVIAAVVVALGLLAGLVIAARVLASRAPGIGAKSPGPNADSPDTEPGTLPPSPADDGRLLAREEELAKRQDEIAERERRMTAREGEIDEVRNKAVRALERASGLSASQAKAILLQELEDQVRHESARRVRASEEEKRSAGRG